MRPAARAAMPRGIRQTGACMLSAAKARHSDRQHQRKTQRHLRSNTSSGMRAGDYRKNSRAALEQRIAMPAGSAGDYGRQQHAVIPPLRPADETLRPDCRCGWKLLPAQHLVVETQSRFISTLLAPVPPRPVAKLIVRAPARLNAPLRQRAPATGEDDWVCIRFNVSSRMVSGVNRAAMRASCVSQGWIRWRS